LNKYRENLLEIILSVSI